MVEVFARATKIEVLCGGEKEYSDCGRVRNGLEGLNFPSPSS